MVKMLLTCQNRCCNHVLLVLHLTVLYRHPVESEWETDEKNYYGTLAKSKTSIQENSNRNKKILILALVRCHFFCIAVFSVCLQIIFRAITIVASHICSLFRAFYNRPTQCPKATLQNKKKEKKNKDDKVNETSCRL